VLLIDCCLFQTYLHSFKFSDQAVVWRQITLILTSCSNHCLAALHLGAGVEQLFDCLIIQNRQDVPSMRRSMDWTVKDNIVDGLFFCAKLTGGSGASGVQRSGDARGDCLIGCPPTKFYYWAVACEGHCYWIYAVCLWRCNMTSYSRLQTNILATFVGTTCIFRTPGQL